MFWPVILFPFVVGWLFVGSGTATWLFAASQLALVLNQIKRGQVTGLGGFLFMSFLFFGVRPLYILIEKDYRLFRGLFHIPVDQTVLDGAMGWATAGMIAFWLGAVVCGAAWREAWRRRVLRSRAVPVLRLATLRMVRWLLVYQFLSLPVMLYLAKGGRALYGSAFGAYGYDFPVVLQAGHIFALVVILEFFLRRRDGGALALLVLAGAVFLYFTWLMREVSIFRGFYVAGVMVAGIAALSRVMARVNLLWLILPVMLLQPLFRTAGEVRRADNEALVELGVVGRSFDETDTLGSYWRFYDGGGDMNIFDTFVAALAAEPRQRPYALSWVYVPFHLVPRAFWREKPERGVLQDLTFMYGAPYCPGITGFFVLDGGGLWMLGCMVILGYLVALLDGRVLTMPPGYLRCCLIGIVVVNAMFLTRFFLWQAFYKAVYSMVPCILLAWFFRRNALRLGTRLTAPRDGATAVAGAQGGAG